MNFKKSHRGFTLIEMIVAVAIFSIVSTVAITALLALTNANRVAQASRKAVDNLDFIMDDIIREARLGKNYRCPIVGNIKDLAPSTTDTQANDCSGDISFALTRLDTNDIVRYGTSTLNGKSVLVKNVTNSSGSLLAQSTLSAEGIDIKSLKFYVSGSALADGEAAKVLVTLQATIEEGKPHQATLNLQTTIAQRVTDN